MNRDVLPVNPNRVTELCRAISRSSDAVVYFDSGETAIDHILVATSEHYPELKKIAVDLSLTTDINQLTLQLGIEIDEWGMPTPASTERLQENYLILQHFGRFILANSDSLNEEEFYDACSVLSQVVKPARAMLTYDSGWIDGDQDDVLDIAREVPPLDNLLRDHAVIDIIR